MRTLLKDVLRHSALFLTLVLTPSLLSSQARQAPSVTPLPEDNLPPAEFTLIMKEAWTFLKDETDAYAKTIAMKGEFETTAEFQKRCIVARQQYLTKLTKYVKDKKFDQRVIGVLLKANLDKYDADHQIYSVSCPADIEAPYNLPSVSTEVPANNYVWLADSIKKGYRTSSIRLKLNPYFRWQVGRDIAKATKNAEADVTFKARFKIEMMALAEGGKGARFIVVPKQVMLMNQKTNTIYWDQMLR
jgi:hypothetical protein